MLRASAVAGKSVLSRASGARVATVRDLVTSLDYSRIIGLVTDQGSLFSPARVIPFKRVINIGNDAVMVDKNDAVVTVDQAPDVKEVLDGKLKLVGKDIFSDQGDRQGTLHDLYFDENSGQVLGYEMEYDHATSGSKGYAYLPSEAVVSIGRDALVAAARDIARLDKQPSWMAGATQAAQPRS